MIRDDDGEDVNFGPGYWVTYHRDRDGRVGILTGPWESRAKAEAYIEACRHHPGRRDSTLSWCLIPDCEDVS